MLVASLFGGFGDAAPHAATWRMPAMEDVVTAYAPPKPGS